MLADSIERQRDPRSGGVLAVIGCCIALFWPGALNFGFPGVMAPLWQEMFHIGRGASGNTIFFMLAGVGIFMSLVGRWQERYGTRTMMAIGIVITSLNSAMAAFLSSVSMLYVWAFITGLSSCFVYIPALTTVQKWYPEKKGLVAGIASMVFGLSAAVMSPLFGRMLTTAGYESTSYLTAALTVSIGMVGAYLSRSPSPEANERISAAITPEIMSRWRSSMTVQESIRTRSFWFLWITWAMQGAAGIAMIALSAGFGLSKGFTLQSAILILTAFNATNGMGRVVSGVLSDIYGRNRVMSAMFLAAGAAYLAMPHAEGLFQCMALAAVIGLSFGTLFSVSAPLVTDCFGLKHFGTIFGLVFTGYGFIAGILGPSLSGYILDMTGGNYSLVFSYLAVFCLASGVLIRKVIPQRIIIRRPQSMPRSE